MITGGAAVGSKRLEQFQADGFVIVRGLIPSAEVDVIRKSFMDLAANGPVEGLSEIRHGAGSYAPTDPLARYPRMMHPHRHEDLEAGKLAMRYMLDPRIGEVLRELMEDEPLAAQSMFYFKPPGARGQDLHQDNFYLRVRPGTCMAAWMAWVRRCQSAGWREAGRRAGWRPARKRASLA